MKQTLITQTSLPCVTSSNNCIKSECCVESRCGGSQEKSPQKPIIPTRIESNTVNSSSLPCITPVIGGRPKSVSPLAVAKPVRPSILKPSKSISGGHRRTCPKGNEKEILNRLGKISRLGNKQTFNRETLASGNYLGKLTFEESMSLQ